MFCGTTNACSNEVQTDDFRRLIVIYTVVQTQSSIAVYTVVPPLASFPPSPSTKYSWGVIERCKYCSNAHCTGLLSAERFDFITQLCLGTAAGQAPLFHVWQIPSWMSLWCFCVMLWSVVFHASSDATGLFPFQRSISDARSGNEQLPTQQVVVSASVPWSVYLNFWANCHKHNPYESLTDVLLSNWPETGVTILIPKVVYDQHQLDSMVGRNNIL